jgi:hypothetical protein
MRKLKITASKQQLESIGIHRDIEGMFCTFIQDYFDGYFEIEMPVSDELKKLDIDLEPERWDIRSLWVDEVSDIYETGKVEITEEFKHEVWKNKQK